MPFNYVSPIDDGWQLDEVAPPGPEPDLDPISRASSGFEQAYWEQVEKRCPAFILGHEDHEKGSFGEMMQELAARLPPATRSRLRRRKAS